MSDCRISINLEFNVGKSYEFHKFGVVSKGLEETLADEDLVWDLKSFIAYEIPILTLQGIETTLGWMSENLNFGSGGIKDPLPLIRAASSDA